MHYGIPVNNMLCNYFDVTVAHYGEKISGDDIKFEQIILSHRKIGPFIYFKENIYKLCQQYDSVISYIDLHILPYVTLGLHKQRKFALTYYGIGVSASYNKKFDEDKKFDAIQFLLRRKAESNVFYSEYPMKKYIKAGFDANSLFVAHNTLYVPDKIAIPKEKKYFLFVGTLYKAKKIYDLLDAYEIFCKNNDGLMLPLFIIGEGEERDNIENWIRQRGYQNKILLKGAIYDQEILKSYYQHAIASISPGQAGLSVLSSLAYGVPFITTKDAVTGGELFNIKNNNNGFLYSGDISELANIMSDLANNQDRIYALSKNAQHYYFENRTMEQMVNGLADAIQYALAKKRGEV
jgi:glycosyltransferase involved in cell wall biosynthesis